MLLIKKNKNIANTLIFFQEGVFIIKNLIYENDKIQAYRLRHKIFSEELRWAPQSEDLMETDDYDDNAVFFGVFTKQNKLIAFIRLILSNEVFMIEDVFSSFIGSGHKIRKENNTAEISRLCVSHETREIASTSSNFDIHNISMLLYKGVYQWCVINNIRYLYLVVELKIYRLLRAKGFPCEKIGRQQTMPDGCTALAALLDWRKFEILNMEKRLTMLKWFMSLERKSYALN